MRVILASGDKASHAASRAFGCLLSGAVDGAFPGSTTFKSDSLGFGDTVSAWEADALPTELCPRTFDSLSMGLMLLIAHSRCGRAR